MDKLTIKTENIVLKLNTGSIVVSGGNVQSVNGRTGNITLNANDVGAEPLGSVANLKSYVDDQDALKANISYVDSEVDGLQTLITLKADSDYVDQHNQLLQEQIDSKANAQAVNQALSLKADLDESGKVPASQLPSYVDDVLEGRYINPSLFNNLSGAPYIAESGKLYVDVDTNLTYRWSGMLYVSIGGGGVALGETSETAYRGDRGKIAYDHSQSQGNPHNSTTSNIPEGTRQYFTESRVRLTPLTGYVDVIGTVNAADNVLTSIGKLQWQSYNASANMLVSNLTGYSVGPNAALSASLSVLENFGRTQGQINAINNNFSVNVRSTLLTGYALGTSAPVASTDTVLGAFGKLQNQINSNQSQFNYNVRQADLYGIDVTMTSTTINGLDTVITGMGKLQGQIANTQNVVRGTILTGFTSGSAAQVSSSDSVLQAIGKLQGQLSQFAVPNWLDIGLLGTVNSSLTNVDIQLARWGNVLWIRGSFTVSATIAQNATLFSLGSGQTNYKFRSERISSTSTPKQNLILTLNTDNAAQIQVKVITDGLLRNQTEAAIVQHFDVLSASGITTSDGFCVMQPQPLGKLVN